IVPRNSWLQSVAAKSTGNRSAVNSNALRDAGAPPGVPRPVMMLAVREFLDKVCCIGSAAGATSRSDFLFHVFISQPPRGSALRHDLQDCRATFAGDSMRLQAGAEK